MLKEIYIDNFRTLVNFNDFAVNAVPTACIVKDGNYSVAVSRWVSPKRTRYRPFEQVYNTTLSQQENH
jgi:hypothetical protein